MRFSKIGNKGSGNGGNKPNALRNNKTVVNACSALLFSRGGLGAMERDPSPTSPVPTISPDHESDSDRFADVVADNRSDLMKVEPIEQAHERVSADSALKDEKGGARVPPPRGGEPSRPPASARGGDDRLPLPQGREGEKQSVTSPPP